MHVRRQDNADLEPHPAPAVRFHVAAPAAHASRDLLGQTMAKLAGLGVFTAAAHASGTLASTIDVIVPACGAAAGFNIGYKIASQQFGDITAARRAAAALCGLGGAAAGVAFAAGDVGAIASVAAVTVFAGVGCTAARWIAGERGQNVASGMKAEVAVAGVALGGFAYAAGHLAETVPRPWFLTDNHIMARQLGAVAEACLVECFKELLTIRGPVVDRKALNLEGRLVAALMGLPAYVIAATLINATSAGHLGEAQGSLDFGVLAPLVVLSCIPNFVRGGANALTVLHAWKNWRRTGVAADPCEHTAKTKAAADLAVSMLDKAAIRWIMIVPRNVLFEALRRHGYEVATATALAQGAYAMFAQFRDVFPDLMAGDGWTPVTQERAPDPETFSLI